MLNDDDSLGPGACSNASDDTNATRLFDLAGERSSHQVTSSRLMVPTSDGNLYLPCNDVLRLQADGSYTFVFTHHGERLLTCKGIGLLHKQLPTAWFHRCHNAHVINLLKVRKLISHGGHRAELFTGDLVEVSRRRWKDLLVAMSSLNSR